MITKPMKAETLEIESPEALALIPYPVLATPKLDGIRCITRELPLSLKFIPIPNKHVQKTMIGLPNELDGELMPHGVPRDAFGSVCSAFMKEEGAPDFRYNIFDYAPGELSTPYTERIEQLKALVLPDFCAKLLPVWINNEAELLAYEAQCLAEGYEGIMIRLPSGPYKCGCSTLREFYLLKVKRFKDSEAVIIGFEEQMHNTNEKVKDNLGHSKRAHKKEGMVPANSLGKFLVREIGETPWKGKEFKIGTGEGLTQELRKTIWLNKEQYLGKIITYKYQGYGIKELPRLPIYKGFRDERDMS